MQCICTKQAEVHAHIIFMEGPWGVVQMIWQGCYQRQLFLHPSDTGNGIQHHGSAPNTNGTSFPLLWENWKKGIWRNYLRRWLNAGFIPEVLNCKKKKGGFWFSDLSDTTQMKQTLWKLYGARDGGTNVCSCKREVSTAHHLVGKAAATCGGKGPCPLTMSQSCNARDQMVL